MQLEERAKPPIGWNKGRNNPMYGKRHTEETRKKMSDTRKGANHYNWKGGVSKGRLSRMKRIEYKLWRDAVYARDNWTCKMCGEKRLRLNAHHIKSYAEYPELVLAIDNGITLCTKCHNEETIKQLKIQKLQWRGRRAKCQNTSE